MVLGRFVRVEVRPEARVQPPDHPAEILRDLRERGGQEATGVRLERPIEPNVGREGRPHRDVGLPLHLGEDRVLRVADQDERRNAAPRGPDQLGRRVQVVRKGDGSPLGGLEGVDREGVGGPHVPLDHQLRRGADHLRARLRVAEAGDRQVEGRRLPQAAPGEVVQGGGPGRRRARERLAGFHPRRMPRRRRRPPRPFVVCIYDAGVVCPAGWFLRVRSAPTVCPVGRRAGVARWKVSLG